MNRFRNNRRSVFGIVLSLMLIISMFAVMPVSAISSSRVTIGQATNGEGGRTSGCKAGDQSGGEVSLSNWGYSGGSSSPYNWQYVFRAKDPAVAKKIAANMIAAANNNHIGYDKKQPDRFTFFDEAKKVDWDISAITTNCETTCASAVSVCLNAVGIKVPRLWYSEIVYGDIMATGAFDCFTSSDYTASPDKLLPGDILCNPKRHTAMVVASPNKFEFNVKYKNTNGKNKVSKVEEGNSLSLNLNNGESIKKVKVKTHVNLKKYVPERSGCTFTGWKKVDRKSYSAQYEYQYAPIITNNDAVALK